jgi:hypothetical protein
MNFSFITNVTYPCSVLASSIVVRKTKLVLDRKLKQFQCRGFSSIIMF